VAAVFGTVLAAVTLAAGFILSELLVSGDLILTTEQIVAISLSLIATLLSIWLYSANPEKKNSNKKG
jgi:hypothetical protein